MKKPVIVFGGFNGLQESEPFITASENKKNTQKRKLNPKNESTKRIQTYC